MLETHVPDATERAWIGLALLSLLGLEVEVGSEQLFGAWRTFFERLAASAPVVMVFEDFHFADPGLIDFVEQMLERSRSLPIFILTLSRPELYERRRGWGAGKRSFTSLHLEPLSTAAMRELLEGLVPGIAEGAREAIVELGGGCAALRGRDRAHAAGPGSRDARGRYLSTGGGPHRPGRARDADGAHQRPARRARPSRPRPPRRRGCHRPELQSRLAGRISGLDSAALEPRLQAMVRRELLTQEVDPRSPERGNYAFVQALIREVAYNTIAKKERKVRHLAAARYFESLGNDELAGALAGHYLAAQGYASDAAESAALAAQARAALHGRPTVPRPWVPTSRPSPSLIAPSPSARTLRTGPSSTPRRAPRRSHGLDGDVAEHHSKAALDAQRELGDREAIALAIAPTRRRSACSRATTTACWR